MWKKIFIVGGITGLGHILQTGLVPVAVRYIDSHDVARIGVIDSLFAIVIAIVSFGMQLTTTRDIATTKNWRIVLGDTQKARLALSLIISMVGLIMLVLSNWNSSYLVLLLSPVVALNLDFALYGKGLPIKAAAVSFMRLSMPVATILILMVTSGHFNSVYYLWIMCGFAVLSGFIVTKILKVPYFPPINPRSVAKYKESFWIGLSTLAITLNRSGLIYIASILLYKDDVVLVFGIMKILLLFIGVKRLLVQTYYKDLLSRAKAKRIDQIFFILGLFSAFTLFVFNEHFSSLIFGTEIQNAASSVFVLSIVIFIVSVFPTSDAVLLLKKKDDSYIRTNLLSASIMILSIGIGTIAGAGVIAFYLGIIISELTLTCVYKFHLVQHDRRALISKKTTA